MNRLPAVVGELVAKAESLARTCATGIPLATDDRMAILAIRDGIATLSALTASPATGEEWRIVEAWVHDGTVAELKLERRFRGADTSEVTGLCGQQVTFATPQPAAASEWVMVPREPTRAMWEALRKAMGDHSDSFDDWWEFEGQYVAKNYAAMLAASPRGAVEAK